jgi:acetoin utilization protein AcuB
MTACPDTIDADTPLRHARERMDALECRHLPVVRDGRLVGILSARDVGLTERLHAQAGSARVPTVEDAMTPSPFTCTADAHLSEVAKEMAAGKYGCAVVMDADHPTVIVGLFTTTDALLALSLLAPQEHA